MTSYHEYNKIDKAAYLIQKLSEGMDIALVTDAGTPGISDPGEEIVRQAYASGISVTSLPGACACVTALTLSGLPTRRFAFEAFLPHAKKERKTILDSLKTETRTIILYEAPHHLKSTLSELYEALGERKITLCKELTKLHETVIPTTISAAIETFKQQDPKGEYVLVIDGIRQETLDAIEQEKWKNLSVREHFEYYRTQGFDRKESMKKAAQDRGVSKREIYQVINKNE